MNTFQRAAHKSVIDRRAFCWIWIAVFTYLPLHAQITFTASEMLTIIGNYSQEYISTNTNPSAMIGPSGGPQVWDFSQTLPGDYVRRLDIVPPTDGGYQASFPSASYAERFTDGVSIFQEWDYYSLTTNAGRMYYGSYNTSSGVQVFSPVATDIPAVVGYGSNWNYTSTSTFPPFTFNETVTCSADAYGSVVLPQIGRVQALRVNQLTAAQELLGSTPITTYYLREYFWLVPGIGKAVDIISSTSSTPPLAIFASADEVRRVFQVSCVSSTWQRATNLQIQLKTGQASLNWLSATNGSGYQVQAVSTPTMTNWQIMAYPASNSWSEALTATQRFYRVFIQP